ncbi:hypothetical protein ASPFODRAFT_503326 [Aspergillus luchuensis CBS 106.47]|uniref:Uncharacterized protein n=1 Tax=Aspergillus luchuensis (strain CBS 106.47) TaxID=1137211 RepID=A0A1M3TT36_ASPLC|nr:hypothetical protein ASPFODRAFT_503326 [Aspergillus luchuensis CBS 106.47]
MIPHLINNGANSFLLLLSSFFLLLSSLSFSLSLSSIYLAFNMFVPSASVTPSANSNGAYAVPSTQRFRRLSPWS